MNPKFKKLFITGGAGYVGACLVPKLLEAGYQVTVFDLMIYGQDVLSDHPNLTKVRGDIRDINAMEQHIGSSDAVIHLACISNDPSFELNPSLGKSINLDSFEPLVQLSRNSGVKRFIYASSSSVYGVKKESKVTEELSLEPLTDYSKFKAECEVILQKYSDDSFTTVTLRPATVCGYSPRQRLDVVVNILTNLAYHKRMMTVFGGDQLRPNIHISDMVDAYLKILDCTDEEVNGEIFNVGSQNHSVNELAQIVREIVGVDVEISSEISNDNRSYHISSDKIRSKIGFSTQLSVKQASQELVSAFENGKLIDPLDNPLYFNIKMMQKINLR
jgi:nucleoside-diphosphate-sugar epimerase